MVRLPILRLCLLASILILGSCQATTDPRSGADVPATSELAANSVAAPHQQSLEEVMKEHNQIKEQGLLPLVTDVSPTMSPPDAREIQSNRARYDKDCIQRAYCHFRMTHDDRPPTSVAELNTMLFILPAQDPFGRTPVTVQDDLHEFRASPQSQPVAWDGALHLSVSSAGVEFLDATYDWESGLAGYVPTTINSCPDNMAGVGPKYITREGVAKITALPFRKSEPPEERAMRLIQQYGPFMATEQEARLFFLAQDLNHLVNEVIKARKSFPTSIDEAAELLGLALTNVEVAPETDATVIVGFDGVQAYRYTVKFPDGTVYDAVTYWHKLSASDGFSTTYPYAKFRDEVGRPFETIGAFKLAN